MKDRTKLSFSFLPTVFLPVTQGTCKRFYFMFKKKIIAIETSEQSMLEELSLQDLENWTFSCNKVQLPDILSSWWIFFKLDHILKCRLSAASIWVMCWLVNRSLCMRRGKRLSLSSRLLAKQTPYSCCAQGSEWSFTVKATAFTGKQVNLPRNDELKKKKKRKSRSIANLQKMKLCQGTNLRNTVTWSSIPYLKSPAIPLDSTKRNTEMRQKCKRQKTTLPFFFFLGGGVGLEREVQEGKKAIKCDKGIAPSNAVLRWTDITRTDIIPGPIWWSLFTVFITSYPSCQENCSTCHTQS